MKVSDHTRATSKNNKIQSIHAHPPDVELMKLLNERFLELPNKYFDLTNPTRKEFDRSAVSKTLARILKDLVDGSPITSIMFDPDVGLWFIFEPESGWLRYQAGDTQVLNLARSTLSEWIHKRWVRKVRKARRFIREFPTQSKEAQGYLERHHSLSSQLETVLESEDPKYQPFFKALSEELQLAFSEPGVAGKFDTPNGKLGIVEADHHGLLSVETLDATHDPREMYDHQASLRARPSNAKKSQAPDTPAWRAFQHQLAHTLFHGRATSEPVVVQLVGSVARDLIQNLAGVLGTYANTTPLQYQPGARVALYPEESSIPAKFKGPEPLAIACTPQDRTPLSHRRLIYINLDDQAPTPSSGLWSWLVEGRNVKLEAEEQRLAEEAVALSRHCKELLSEFLKVKKWRPKTAGGESIRIEMKKLSDGFHTHARAQGYGKRLQLNQRKLAELLKELHFNVVRPQGKYWVNVNTEAPPGGEGEAQG